MQENDREMFDEDREEVLRLILSEVAGEDVRRELAEYPIPARNLFRRIVQEAGLVQTRGTSRGDAGEVLFEGATLTPRGRKRLDELNARRNAPGNQANGHDADVDDDEDDDLDDE